MSVRARLALCALLLPPAGFSVYFCSRQALRTSQDFGTRWVTLRVILHRENPYRLKLKGGKSELVNELRRGKFAPFDPQYLPSSLVPMLPYALLDHRSAVRAWLATNMAAAGVLTLMLSLLAWDRLRPEWHVAMALLFVCSAAFRIGVANGQLATVALAFLALALWLEERNRPVLSGLALALALLKYHLTLPFVLVFFLLRARWTALGVCAAFHAAAHLALCAWMRASPFGVVADIFQLNRQTAAAYRWFDAWSVVPALMGKGPVGPPRYLVAAGFVVVAGAYLVYLWFRRGAARDRLTWLGATGAFSLFASYHRVYDAVCLYPALLWLVAAKGMPWQRALAAPGVVALLFVHPVVRYGALKGRVPFETVWTLTALLFYLMLVAAFAAARTGVGRRRDPSKKELPRARTEPGHRGTETGTDAL